MSGGTRSVLEGLLQRPVKGYFNGPVKRTRTFIYGTPQRHLILLKLMFRISVVRFHLTILIQKISYHNRNSSGLYLIGYDNIPKVLPYTPSVIIHHNKRVSVCYCPLLQWGERSVVDRHAVEFPIINGGNCLLDY